MDDNSDLNSEAPEIQDNLQTEQDESKQIADKQEEEITPEKAKRYKEQLD
jgi:hypothetical protein